MRRYRLYRGIHVLATVYSKEIPPPVDFNESWLRWICVCGYSRSIKKPHYLFLPVVRRRQQTKEKSLARLTGPSLCVSIHMNVSIQLHYLALVTPGALLLGTHYSEVFVCKLSHHLSCLKLIKGTGPLGIRCMKSPKPPTRRHQGYSMSPQRPLIILHFTLQLFPVFQLALFNFLFSLFCGS